MTIAATPVPLSEAKARLSELARRVRQQHERITLTRNGEPEAVLVSVDDLEGLEMTLEILGDTEAVARISESLAALGRGEPGVDLATVRQDLARRRAYWHVSTEPEQRYQIRFQPAARRAIRSGFPRRSPLPCWSSARLPLLSTRTASVSRCSARWLAATEHGAAHTGLSIESRKTPERSRSSTSTTAPRSTVRTLSVLGRQAEQGEAAASTASARSAMRSSTLRPQIDGLGADELVPRLKGVPLTT